VECLLRNHARLRADQHTWERQCVLALETLAMLEMFSCFVLKSSKFTQEIDIPSYLPDLLSKCVQYMVCKSNVLVYN